MDIERISREDAQAMDGFRIHGALLALLERNNSMSDELQENVKLIALAETRLIFAITKEEKDNLRAEIINLKSVEKLLRIRNKTLQSNKSILQTAAKVHA